MNREEYISSGMLESYILGSATSSEKNDVETMAQTNPEIKRELDEIENGLNNYAAEHSIAPPAYLKEKILETVFGEQKNTFSKATDNLRTLPPAEPPTISPYPFWAIAASILLLLSIIGNAYFMMESGKRKQSVATVTKTNTALTDSQQTLTASNKQMQDDMAILKDPMYKIVELKGMKASPDAKATICWCPMDKKVYVEIDRLPPPPQGMQYQLWAFVDGKPVSEGMLTIGTGLHRMPDVDKAQAFAVTLEKQGGSPIPKGDIYVMGSI